MHYFLSIILVGEKLSRGQKYEKILNFVQRNFHEWLYIHSLVQINELLHSQVSWFGQTFENGDYGNFFANAKNFIQKNLNCMIPWVVQHALIYNQINLKGQRIVRENKQFWKLDIQNKQFYFRFLSSESPKILNVPPYSHFSFHFDSTSSDYARHRFFVASST